MHPRICLLAQTILMKSKASTHELEPRAWEGRNEVAAQLCPVGRFDLPARLDIKHQTPQVVPSNDNAGLQTSCVPPRLSKRSF